MTQIGEAVAIGVINDPDVPPCPLNHDNLAPIQSSNNFIGDGGKLGDNMKAGTSTITYEANRSGPIEKRPYPTSAADEDWPVEVDGHFYPVTCAAHHIIPAQASLKKAKVLHKFMVYKKQTEPVGGSGGGPAKGVVWADVGYDINGTENGVWLPGNYAVGGGAGGTGEWTSAPSALDNEKASAKPAPPTPADSRKLTGDRHTFFDANRKGQYVMGATYLYNAQFHDSHGEYSDIVTTALDKLGTLYQERKYDTEPPCPKCKERLAKVKEEGSPTPFALAHRLNAVSERFSRYLIGKRGHPVIYTSNWGKGAHLEGMHMVSSNSPIPLE